MKHAPSLALLLSLLSVPLQGASIPVGGRVVDPAGKGLANARIALLPILPSAEDGRLELAGKADPEPAATGVSDAAGAFLLQAPQAGMWKVRVEAAGYVPLEVGLVPLLEETDLPDARLVPDVHLQVRLTDPAGRPVAGGRVGVEAPQGSFRFDEQWRISPRLALTDAGGSAVLPRAKDEALTVRAAATGLPLVEQQNVRSGAVALRFAGGRSRRILVRDSQGKGLTDVLVRFAKSQWPAGLTSENGLLDLVLPDAGAAELRLGTADGRRLTYTLKAAKPDEKGPAIIVLPAAVPLSGKVVSATDGRPLAGAIVWTSDLGAAVRATGAGAFRLPAVEDDDSVTAAAAGFFNNGARVRANHSPTLTLKPNLSATGIVVDEGGRPVAGAAIRVESSAAWRIVDRWGGWGLGFARSRESGRFRIGGLGPGFASELRVTHEGYAPAKAEVPAGGPGQPAPELRIVLRAGRTAFGAVLDGGRQPVAGARVILQPAVASPSARMRGLSNPQKLEGSTDASGRFEVKNLPAGSFDLTVRGKGFAPLTVPGLAVPQGAGRTDLGTVVLSSGASLRGWVVDAKGSPIEGAEVRARSPQTGMSAFFMMDDTEPADAVSGADGSFLLEDRAAGEKVDLNVSHPSYGPSTTPGVTIPAETPVRIVLQPTARVSGRTVDPEGKPIPGAQVDLNEMPSMSFGGQSALRPFGRHQTAKADDEGSFSFDGVSPGFIQLKAHALRRQDAEVKGLEVKPGGALTGVEIVLVPGASIAGRVLGPDGQPVPNAQVRLAEPSQDRMAFFSFFPGANGTDGDGRYRLDGVPPGPRTLEASAEGYRRAVRDLDVAGEMEGVDFTLDKGLEISGRVVDDAGAPIPGATVLLLAGRGPFSTPPAVSGADGGFRFAGVQDGTFRLAAHKDGYSISPRSETVTVAGASVSGVELKLSTGGNITGRLTGLELNQLSRVRVWANFEMYLGQVDADGGYRISGLAAGPWEVTAVVPGTALHASGRVSLDPGASEAHLDLQFGGGHELTGVVLRNGQPIAGAGLTLSRQGTVERQTGATDHQGSFRFGGLENGAYELAVSTPNGAQHRENVELAGDREIRVELRTASLSGRVIDALDSSPVSGVHVSLEPVDGEGTSFPLTTDARGSFRLLEVGDGAWRLKLVREGYAPAERELRVDGSSLDDLEIRLSPTEGVAIEAVLPSGQPPDRLQVAVLDAAGKTLSSGTYPVGETGRARITSVPRGSWQLLVESDQSAPTVVAVSVPGPAVRALLPAGGTVRVKVPALANDPAKAKVTLTGAGGAYRSIDWNGTVLSEFDLSSGITAFSRVPAGVWQLVARASDGRSWSGTATVTPGGVVEITLQ